jgi:hypothetical protein
MNLDFITDFAESRNQSGFSRVYEREFRRVSVKLCPVLANCDSARRFTDTSTESGHSNPPKFFFHPQLRMEARSESNLRFKNEK